MRAPDQALAWLDQQRASGSTAWHNMCESLCRQAYGLPAHYSSANLHADAIPAANRDGHATPERGSLVLYRNATYGHIVVATGRGWECYTNDYGGRGRVTLTDARNLVSWCNASSWFVADAWWSPSNVRPTQTGDEPMALTDDDVARIAREVWRYRNPDVTDKQAYAFLRNMDTPVSGVDEAVWKVPTRTLTSAAGSPSLTDADVARIARAVLDGMAARMEG